MLATKQVRLDQFGESWFDLGYDGFGAMPNFFISFASQDKSAAEALCRALEDQGCSCWIAPRDIRPGRLFGHAIVEAIDAAKALVLLLSRSSLNSDHVIQEVDRAFERRIAIVPVRLEAIAPTGAMGYYLAGRQWLDAFPPPLEECLARIAIAIQGSTNDAAGLEGTGWVAPRVTTATDSKPAGPARSSFAARARRLRSSRRFVPLVALSLAVVTGIGYAGWRALRSEHRQTDGPDRDERNGEPASAVGAELEEVLANVATGQLARAAFILERERGERPVAPGVESLWNELDRGTLVMLERQAPTEAGRVRISAGSAPVPLRETDNYRFAIVAKRDCFLYAYQRDSRPSITRLFPNGQFTARENPLEGGVRYWLPDESPSGDPRWFHLDEHRGRERVLFIALRRPLRDPDAFGQWLLERGDVAPSDLAARLADHVEPGEGPAESCFAGERLQVLELDHR